MLPSRPGALSNLARRFPGPPQGYLPHLRRHIWTVDSPDVSLRSFYIHQPLGVRVIRDVPRGERRGVVSRPVRIDISQG